MAAEEDGDDERVSVRMRCTPREAGLWVAAVELARRVAGEELAVWQCAEQIAAEAASAVGAPDCAADASEREGGAGVAPAAGASACGDAAAREHGLRERAFPGLRWKSLAASLPHRLAVLARDLPACTPREVERRLVAAVAFLQRVDFEVARVLRQVVARRLHRELGFACFERYARERLDLAPRTARRLVSLARVEHRAPEAASAFRTGRITAFQAQAIARVADLESARAWVERARAVSLRRLLDDVGSPPAPEIAFTAPRAAARFFVAMLGRAGSLERMLAHAIATWMEAEAQFRDYADFARDGYRCTVPGCSARRNLQSHHVRFRSAGGPDEAWNRTTLCAHHHLRGVHGGTLRIRGRAPAELVFALGPEPAERFRSGDVRVEGGRG